MFSIIVDGEYTIVPLPILKIKKKPVIVQAVQLKREDLKNVIKWIGLDLFHPNFVVTSEGLAIQTLEGEMLCRWDDYLIKGVKGEFYPIKKDILEETYYIIEEV